MREERIKAVCLAALIAAEVIPLDGAMIERASKALDRAAMALIMGIGVKAHAVSIEHGKAFSDDERATGNELLITRVLQERSPQKTASQRQ